LLGRAERPRVTVSRRRLPALLACAAALLVLNLLGLDQQRHDEIGAFVAVALAQGAIYLLAVWLIWNAAASRRTLVMILAAAALLRLPVLLAPPYLSTDIYRYVWDGRVEAAGINPYRYIPVDPHLAKLRDQRIFPRINRNNYAPTIYPPAAEAIFFLVTRFSQSLFAMKSAMVVCDAITIFLLLRLLAAARLPLGRILVYAWHPLPIWEFAGSGHIDAAMIAFVALALWAARRGNGGLTGLALAGATLTKLYPALLLPALYRRWEWRMPAVFVTAVILCYLPFIGVGWRVLGFLPGYAVEEGFTAAGPGFYPWSLLQTTPFFAGLPALVYIAGAAALLFVLALAVLFARNAAGDEFAAAAPLAGAFMLLLSPHYPWYFTWLIVFACFAPLLSLLWVTNASFLLYLVPVGSQLVPSEHRLLVESVIYGPFAVLGVRDLWRCRAAARGEG
jgi:alpha-1,6-mannosyltransferase